MGINYRTALRRGTQKLKDENIRDAAVDAGFLLEYACNMDRATYLLKQADEIPESELHDFNLLIEKRAQHVPLQYITGKQNFYGYDFTVTPDVLIPRLDTEILVETVLKQTKKMEPGLSVLDLCTGSGCILISLLKENTGLVGTGSDISKAALNVAKENAGNLGVRANWIRGDLFEAIEGSFDIIVSNPPYIPSMDIYDLDAEVKEFEPLSALDGEEDGLAFYRRITEEAPAHLNEGGWLFFEIGCDQGEAVSKLMTENGFTDVTVKQDLAKLDRIVMGHL